MAALVYVGREGVDMLALRCHTMYMRVVPRACVVRTPMWVATADL